MRAKLTARLTVFIVALAVLAAAPVAAKPAKDSSAGPPAATPWKAVAASGQVQARYADTAWHAVARGDELMPRTTVETGRKGNITLTRRASLLILDPNSRVDLPDTAASDMETSVVQTQGSVLYKVDSRSHPHFEVVTPYLVAGVKGTSFLVTVNERYAAVTVRQGFVQITDPITGESLLLGPGESGFREREEAELDLVRDRRGSRDARREAKRLKRIDRRESERSRETDTLPSGEEPFDAKAEASFSPSGDDGANASWAADADPLVGTDGDALREEIDSITKELIEEMIREEIRNGTITDPVDSDVTLPPSNPDTPTTPPQPRDLPDKLQSN